MLSSKFSSVPCMPCVPQKPSKTRHLRNLLCSTCPSRRWTSWMIPSCNQRPFPHAKSLGSGVRPGRSGMKTTQVTSCWFLCFFDRVFLYYFVKKQVVPSLFAVPGLNWISCPAPIAMKFPLPAIVYLANPTEFHRTFNPFSFLGDLFC